LQSGESTDAITQATAPTPAPSGDDQVCEDIVLTQEEAQLLFGDQCAP